MATASMTIKDLDRLFGGGAVAGRPDADLLEGFLAQGDEAAFAAIVSRHGGMVLATCRAVLRDPDAAEDVFQATFLVLARKAASVRGRDALGGWLHRVAFRAAVQANKAAARRKSEERKAAAMRSSTRTGDEARDDLRALIHGEVERLPEALRLPVVLCDLEGLSREQAAAELRWTEGTVRGRLARGRERLRARLTRHGLAPTAAALAASLGREATAAVPPSWAVAAARSAALALAGKATAGAPATIASDVIRSMRIARLRFVVGAALGLGALGGAAVGLVTIAEPPREAGPSRAVPPDAKAFVSHGQVLGPDGRPFEGARLAVKLAPGEGKVAATRARSGPDGRFRYEVDRAEFPGDFDLAMWDQVPVVTSAEGFGPDWASLAGYGAQGRTRGPDGGLLLRLTEAGPPIEGRVLDTQGRPVAGASVRVERIMTGSDGTLEPFFRGWRLGHGNPEGLLERILFDPAAAGVPSEVKADAQGRFRVGPIGRDHAARLAISGPGVAGESVIALAREGVTAEELAKVGPETEMLLGKPMRGVSPVHGPTIELVVAAGRSLEGVVREAGTGRPLAGVKVSLVGPASDHQVVTDAEGRYRLSGLPVAAPARLNFYPQGGLDHLPASQVVPAAAGAGPLRAELVMARAITATGRVVERGTGRPVAGSVVYQPLAGNAAFRDTPAGEWIKSVVNAEPLAKDGTFRVPVGPGPGVLLVQIPNPNGPGLSPDYLPARRVLNDGAGSFPGKGEWLVGALNQAIPLDLYQAYAVIDPKPGDAEVRRELEVVRGLSKDGRVTGPDGTPLAGAFVAGLGGVVDGPRVLTAADFKVTLLDPARPRYLFGRDGAGKLAGAVVVRGDEPAPIALRLEPAATIAGRLVDGEGRPVVGARIGLGYREEGGIAMPRTGGRRDDERILTDEGGRFRVESVVGGLPAAIWASKGGRPLRLDGFDRMGMKAGEVKELGDIKAAPFP